MRLLTAIFILAACTVNAQKPSSGFYLARSSGRLTMLGAGLGEDRLGGAKLGYIDTAILLKIIDSTKELYKVQLSQYHAAFVAKADVRKDTVGKLKPYYLTGSISVKGDETYDYINISLSEKLPYISWMEINPSKIVFDIYGVQSNTNWISQLKGAREIKDVYLNQVEDDIVRVTVQLKHLQHWGYTLGYKNSTLSLRVRRQPTALKFSNMFIAIDAGHGGSNMGAGSSNGKSIEKNYTLRYANELEKYLKSKGASVVMTRTTDTTISNVDRVLQLQDVMPDLLISLHFNSSANANIKGVSTYYKHIGFKPVTVAILDRMLQLPLSEFGNVGNFNFTLNAPTDFPNSLVEIGFLSNSEDETKIIDPRFQRAVAKKIYKGIKDWIKMVKE